MESTPANTDPPKEEGDKMLDIDEGASMPKGSQPSKKYLEAKEKEKNDMVQKVDKEMEAKAAAKKVDHDKVYQVMKALTAMKLVKEDGVPGAVFPDIFIGSVGAAYNKENLTKLGVTHILTCAANIKPRFPTDFKYEVLNCLDSPQQSILTHVEKANRFIVDALKDNKEGEEPVNKVLVHCFAGKSRATSFLLCYLMKERKIPLSEGLKLIWQVRQQAAPNPGFMIQLKALEKNVFGKTSETEVMQGEWKEKLTQLKVKVDTQKEQRAGMSSAEKKNELLSPELKLDMPNEEQSIKNVEEQHKEVLGKLLGQSGSHDQLHKEELEASNQKELADAQDALGQAAKE